MKKELHMGRQDQVQMLQGVAEGTGFVQSGEKEAEGRPYGSLLLPKRSLCFFYVMWFLGISFTRGFGSVRLTAGLVI